MRIIDAIFLILLFSFAFLLSLVLKDVPARNVPAVEITSSVQDRMKATYYIYNTNRGL